MVFSSFTFVCAFLPVIFVLYQIVPGLKAKNVLLIVGSLLFYAYGEPVYVLLILVSSLCNYLFARMIAGTKTEKSKKLFLAIAVILNLGALGVFKYAGFAVNSVNAVTGLALPVPQIALPIGISFFTFQALSYVIDVYRGTVAVEKNYLNILLYISFFPQLIAGPIVKFHDINAALRERNHTPALTVAGLRRFICGLGKKVLIANAMGQVADTVFGLQTGQINAPIAWLGAIAYMLQIYYDFSGYSDMAIGLGKMFGFVFRENFNYPYTADNIQDFWRRWHISMSTWFKEYLYFPLGGNRKGKARTSVNKIIVFLCTGLWHGANWTFVLWGAYHGFFLLLESYVPAVKKLPKALGKIYSLLVVCVGFVLFRADNLGQFGHMVAGMFAGFTFTDETTACLMRMLTPWFLLMLVAAVIGAGFIKKPVAFLRQKTEEAVAAGQVNAYSAALSCASLLLLVWCILRLSGQGYNPFIYFRF